MSPLVVAAEHSARALARQDELGTRRILELFGHSTALGTILAAVAYSSGRYFDPPTDGTSVGPTSERDAIQRGVLGASNLLFLCVGLTGTMILVNNNMVRAFAIAAAIALVRFRVKLDAKSANATLLFGVLAGVACGLQETSLAWILVTVHVVLAAFVVLVVRMHGGVQPEPFTFRKAERLRGNETRVTFPRA